jgi:site-specific recombinase XerD
MTEQSPNLPPPWPLLLDGWRVTLEADGYSPKSVLTYQAGMTSFTGWLGANHPQLDPADLHRQHVRGWLAAVRQRNGATTAATYYAGVRHFAKWLVAEGDVASNPTDGVRCPVPSEPATPVLSADELKALLATCSKQTFTGVRDAAIIMLLADGGLRSSELAGLRVADVDQPGRVVYVAGKGTGRRGPRHRAVPYGVRTAQAINRYLRARQRHPFHDTPALWLGSSEKAELRPDTVRRMVRRRGELAGIQGLHPHTLRHTWASQFRAAGGSEGDLMTLGGWRNRAMLDRYGASAAAGRAAESYRKLSLGDRL